MVRVDPGALRVGHQEGGSVAQVLQTGRDEGRLTVQECRERLDALPATRTFADLDALVADLPVPPPSAAVRHGALGASATDADRLRLDGGVSSDVRTGPWTRPRRIDIHGTMGSVRMDCLQALCPHPQVDVYVSGGAGSIVVIVPEGWAASIDQVRKGWGSAKSKVADTPDPGCPRLVFEGNMGMGSLVVRHANWWDRRRLLRQMRKQRAKELTTGWTQANPALDNPSSLR